MAINTLNRFLSVIGRDRAWFNLLSANDQDSIRNWTENYDYATAQKDAGFVRSIIKNATADVAAMEKKNPALAPEVAAQHVAAPTGTDTTSGLSITGTGKSPVSSVPDWVYNALNQIGYLANFPDPTTGLATLAAGANKDKDPQHYWTQLVQGLTSRWVSGTYGVTPAEQNAPVIMERAHTAAQVAAGGPGSRAGTQVVNTVAGAVAQPNTSNWDPDQIKALQDKLVAMGKGLLPIGSFTPGQYDARTQAAYLTILVQANQSNKTPDEIFTQGAASAQSSLKFRATPYIAPVKQQADLGTVQNTIRGTYARETGEDPSAAQMKTLTNVWRQVEAQQYASDVQKAQYENQAANYGRYQSTYQEQISQAQASGMNVKIDTANAPAKPGGPPTATNYNPAADIQNKAYTSMEGQEYRATSAGLYLEDFLRAR